LGITSRNCPDATPGSYRQISDYHDQRSIRTFETMETQIYIKSIEGISYQHSTWGQLQFNSSIFSDLAPVSSVITKLTFVVLSRNNLKLQGPTCKSKRKTTACKFQGMLLE
jgi:hypothetical protein